MNMESKESSTYKIEGRESIHKRRTSRNSMSIENGNFQQILDTGHDAEDTNNSQSCSASSKQHDGLMAEQTNGNNKTDITLCEGPSSSATENQETKQLKELLILHLDLIQQQQELIMAKDRQIGTLTSDNNALKCRLERMERRMSLLKQQNGPSSSRYSRKFIRDEVDIKAVVSPENINKEAESPKTPPEVKQDETENKPLKRKCSPSQDPPPRALNKKFAAASKKKAINRLSQNLKTNLRNKRGTSKLNKLNSSLKKSQSISTPSPQKSRSQMPARLTRAQTQTPSNGFIHPVKIQSDLLPQARNHDSLFQTVTEKIKSKLKCRPINDSDRILRTETLYHVSQDMQPQYLLLSPKKCNNKVEIPSFRINPVANCYTLEGTENLEDEIFLKRHQKPETDEKRRKRWDMQRIREQKLYEKLKEGRCGSKYSSSNFVQEQIETFNPDPEDATHIEITNKIPVNAFGYPIPSLTPGEFSLPWYKVSTQSPTSRSTKKSKLKLKRR